MTVAFYGINNCNGNSYTVDEINKTSKTDLFNDFNNIVSADTYSFEKEEDKISDIKIGYGRLFFNRLKKEDIEIINKTKMLPKNAKFVQSSSNYKITWNLWDVTEGTHKLPAGYEVKNDILGFTHVLPEGTKSIFIK